MEDHLTAEENAIAQHKQLLPKFAGASSPLAILSLIFFFQGKFVMGTISLMLSGACYLTLIYTSRLWLLGESWGDIVKKPTTILGLASILILLALSVCFSTRIW